jgi:hypothetical protein
LIVSSSMFATSRTLLSDLADNSSKRPLRRFVLPPWRPSSASRSGWAWQKHRPLSTAGALHLSPAFVSALHCACLRVVDGFGGLSLMGVPSALVGLSAVGHTTGKHRKWEDLGRHTSPLFLLRLGCGFCRTLQDSAEEVVVSIESNEAGF